MAGAAEAEAAGSPSAGEGSRTAGEEAGRSPEEGSRPEEDCVARISIVVVRGDGMRWRARFGGKGLPVRLLRVLGTAAVVALAGHLCVRC